MKIAISDGFNVVMALEAENAAEVCQLDALKVILADNKAKWHEFYDGYGRKGVSVQLKDA